MPIRLLIADDHPIIREGLKALLEANGYEVAGEASEGQEALRIARTVRPDVAVLDIGMPGLNGVDVARALCAEEPRPKVILLTQHTEDAYVIEALRAGVSGYVLKKQAMSDLVRAIHEVSQGAMYLSPGISRTVVEASLSGAGTATNSLTQREREVLQLIAEGKTTKQIGSILGVSVKTAESHRSRVMDKLEIRDTAGLVRYAIRHGFIAP